MTRADPSSAFRWFFGCVGGPGAAGFGAGGFLGDQIADPPMDRHALLAYVYELKSQVDHALRAYEMHRGALADMAMPGPSRAVGDLHNPDRARRRAARNAYSDALRERRAAFEPTLPDAMDRLQFADQAFLGAVAVASRLLYPADHRRDDDEAAQRFRRERGRTLRDLLRVENNAFRDAKRARDSFEHVDEKIDARIREGRGLAIRNVGPSPFSDGATLRTYDPGTDTIITDGVRIKLAPLVDELRRLRRELDDANPDGAWVRLGLGRPAQPRGGPPP